jgi:hypothetical protein
LEAGVNGVEEFGAESGIGSLLGFESLFILFDEC